MFCFQGFGAKITLEGSALPYMRDSVKCQGKPLLFLQFGPAEILHFMLSLVNI